MNGLTRHPAFWSAYAAVAAVALVIAWRLFPLAIPLVNLDITLARHDAVAKAESLNREFQLSPSGARTAVRFAHDDATQNYVELEGGGKAAFAALVAGNVYAPYWWEVRLFKPGEVDEAVVRFRPDGAVYGFTAKRSESFLPADPARRALDAASARQIAEDSARTDWSVDLSAYKLIEQTQQKRTAGRLDHGFVYERTAGNVADSRFRLRLAVTGDTLTEVIHFVEIPETFERRFVELRSANNTIAGAAGLLAGVLYGLGGCILGVLWLLRRHWLLWKPALAAGFVVGGLMGAMVLADTPSAWFTFDTAQSVATFWTKQLGAAALILLGGGLLYALVFMAAESLSRRAFDDHPQLWRAWSRAAAPTPQVLGRTLGGYLFIPVQLALVAAFYYATNRWLGWWQPSESLTDPNILGSAIPALTPIAVSLQAGFMEECLFRAVPLALAAIIGARYGKRRLAIGIAVVVQALIFGAAHANYPGFPPYSRLIELILPAMLWALIFLRFGLLPTIILHALFDLALFAIPLFLVDAPGGSLQRAIVVGAALVPLAVVIARRAAQGAWHELAPALRNGAWQPSVHVAPAPTVDAEHRAASGWMAAFQRWLPALGVAGFVAWLTATPFHADVPPLLRDRAQAEADADAALAARGVVLGPEWCRLSAPKLAADEPTQWLAHQFVWREAGADAYRKLIGSTLAPPVWDIRYAKFDGDVAQRAEEWRVAINPDGTPRTVRHTLPEALAGATLGRAQAQVLAERELGDRFGLDPAQLRLVGADEKQRPARTDWTFTFVDPRVAVGKDGEARVLVSVAGDEIAAAGRLVHVPEEWQRMERDREGRLTIVKFVLGGLLAFAGIAAIVVAVLEWTRGHVDRRAMIVVAAIAFAAAVVGIANRWPLIAMHLNTAEPVTAQVSIAVLGALFEGLLVALPCGLMAGVGVWAARRQPAFALAGRSRPWVAGVALALVAAGVGAVVARLAPRTAPLWPGYGIEAARWPAVAALQNGLLVVVTAAVVLYVLYWLAGITARLARRKWLAAAIVVLALTAFAFALGGGPLASATAGVIEGLLVAVSVYALLRFDFSAVPSFVAGAVSLHAVVAAAQKGTFDAWAHAALSAAGAVAAAWVLTRYIDLRPVPVIASSPTVE